MTKTITPIILSYNLPDETDQIYDKLRADGFDNVIVVDNGSDQKPAAQSANFCLPKNIRFTGQVRMSLIYVMDYFPTDYYWLITTSTELLPTVNYRTAFGQAFLDLNEMNVGVLSTALDNIKALPLQRFTQSNQSKQYSISFHHELVASLISHELLALARKNQAAFFDLNFTRGWGCNYDLLHLGVTHQQWGVVAHRIPVLWKNNIGFKKNLGGEDIDRYFEASNQEMESVLSKKYGQQWKPQMFAEFCQAVKEVPFPYSIGIDPKDYKLPETFLQRTIKKGLNFFKKDQRGRSI